jgi:hypothetical protein
MKIEDFQGYETLATKADTKELRVVLHRRFRAFLKNLPPNVRNKIRYKSETGC